MIPHLLTLDYMQPTDAVLSDNCIDLWQFPLADVLPESKIILNQEELERAARFYFERHQRRFSTARTRLKQILGKYLSINPAEIIFDYNKYGKPRVINHLELEFNLSHSGDFALLAINKKHPIGVDIERFSARPYTGIAKNLFSLEEQNRLINAPNYYKPYLFFQIWAQKEAFIKACGLGLHYPTQQFTVPRLKEGFVKDVIHNQSWKMLHSMPKINLSAALCYHPSNESIRNFTWNT